MAGIALELAALAFVGYVVMDEDEAPASPSMPQTDTAAPAPPTNETLVEDPVSSSPMDFITEPADGGARYYRAIGSGVELLAGLYSDGRLRLVDPQNRRFAGMLQGGHADVLDLASNEWSEALISTTPSGNMQMELRGGPYDARVLTCEILRQAQDDKLT